MDIQNDQRLEEQHLKETFDAFNRHDIESVMRYFADDCVFFTVSGTEVFGTRIEGRDAIAKAFEGVWTSMPDAVWEDHRHTCTGDMGVSRWTFRGTDNRGQMTEAEGVDIFRFANGKIVEKHAFRKQRPLIPTWY